VLPQSNQQAVSINSKFVLSSVVMEISYVWNDQIPEKDGSKVPVNDMAFSPGNSPHCYASQNLYDAIK